MCLIAVFCTLCGDEFYKKRIVTIIIYYGYVRFGTIHNNKFLAQHSLEILVQCCNHSKQC